MRVHYLALLISRDFHVSLNLKAYPRVMSLNHLRIIRVFFIFRVKITGHSHIILDQKESLLYTSKHDLRFGDLNSKGCLK